MICQRAPRPALQTTKGRDADPDRNELSRDEMS